MVDTGEHATGRQDNRIHVDEEIGPVDAFCPGADIERFLLNLQQRDGPDDFDVAHNA